MRPGDDRWGITLPPDYAEGGGVSEARALVRAV
jgi:hypothetical protein